MVAECSKAGEILFPDAVKATGTFHTLGNLIVLFLGVANPNPDIGRELQELKGSINRVSFFILGILKLECKILAAQRHETGI